MQRGRGSGFTLLELLVVLLIISLISAWVGPRLAGSLGRMTVESAARQVASALRFARSRAVTEKMPYRAVFRMDPARMVVEPYSETEPAEDNADPTDASIPRKAVAFPDGIRILSEVSPAGETVTMDGFEIVFFPSGGASGGAVTLTDGAGRRLSVAVDFITGSVKIDEDITPDGSHTS